jgi:hypothetical protein
MSDETEFGLPELAKAFPAIVLESLLFQAVMDQIERDSMPPSMISACLEHMEHPENDHPGWGYLAEK